MAVGSMSRSATPSPPTWEALQVVAPRLDAESLAAASCVSRTWRAAMSDDHLWLPVLLSHYPSALRLHDGDSDSLRSLFSLLRGASTRRCRCRRSPPPPWISLRELTFVVDVLRDGSSLLSIVKGGEELAGLSDGGLFRFSVDVTDDGVGALGDGELRVVWMVAMKGRRAAFAMVDRVDSGRVAGGSAMWFSEALPHAGGCLPADASCVGGGGGLVAELGMEYETGSDGGAGDERRMVVRVRMGLLSVVRCRYVGLDDGLRYLQTFLPPTQAALLS